MSKLDLKQQHKACYRALAKTPALVDVPPINFVMVDGAGDPNDSAEFQAAMETLYALAYTLKFMCKAQDQDFTVMPLEGLWWTHDMHAFSMDARDIWQWTVMIALPDYVTETMFQAAVDEVRRKKDPAALDNARLERYHEGEAAQIMHIGPYADEAPTIEHLHTWIIDQGYDFHGAGKHHEIYLSDPRRTAPEKMKTIIRQPVIQPEG